VNVTNVRPASILILSVFVQTVMQASLLFRVVPAVHLVLLARTRVRLGLACVNPVLLECLLKRDRPPVGCVQSATRALGAPARLVRRGNSRLPLALVIAMNAGASLTPILELRSVRSVSSRWVHSSSSPRIPRIPNSLILDGMRLGVVLVRTENTLTKQLSILLVRMNVETVWRVTT